METKKGPMKTTVPLKGVYMGFHVTLGECRKLLPLIELKTITMFPLVFQNNSDSNDSSTPTNSTTTNNNDGYNEFSV